MNATARDKVKLLFGPYRPPRCRLGSVLHCEIRGDVTVDGFSRGRISWPMTNEPKRQGRRPAIIVCGRLVEAIRTESVLALRYWFGVGVNGAWKWRRALGVPQFNAGTRRLFREYTAPALHESNRGRPLTIEHRRKFSEIRRRLKMQPPKAGRPWTKAEDRLLGKMLDRDVAARTNRTLSAVRTRRQLLRVPSAYTRGKRMLLMTKLMKRKSELGRLTTA